MSLFGISFGFKTGVVEIYNSNYDTRNITAAAPSAYYQEVFCRLKETATKNEELKDYDWSFDPNNKVIGKNWLKK